MPYNCTITEKDESGRRQQTVLCNGDEKRHLPRNGERYSGDGTGTLRFLSFAKRVFLPSGYPHTVSPDYLRYQVLNALQAFCNSLASLLSSRAILEGHGIGDPTATATHALLLTVLQDIFSRLTTIASAHLLGSSLVPEAKKFRLLADILNDSAVVLDTLSPILNTSAFPSLRIFALCVSASFRALCGIVAGGSKAAITLHFATPLGSTGDVGDLNAKDSSKETVLALLGMLLGAFIVPTLTTPWPTYTTLFTLIALHLAINYIGVKGLVFRTLNRQRTWIAYSLYAEAKGQPPSPSTVNALEGIFDRPSAFRDALSGRPIGEAKMGSSLSEILCNPLPPRLVDIFEEEKYLIWFDHHALLPTGDQEHPKVRGYPQLHICFKTGFSFQDQIKAWVHAGEICREVLLAQKRNTSDRVNAVDALAVVEQSHKAVCKLFPGFIKQMQGSGWNTIDGVLMPGSPAAVLLAVVFSPVETPIDEKKTR